MQKVDFFLHLIYNNNILIIKNSHAKITNMNMTKKEKNNKRLRGKGLHVVFESSSSLLDFKNFGSTFLNGINYKLNMRHDQDKVDFLHIIKLNDKNELKLICYLGKTTGFDIQRAENFFEPALAQGCNLVELNTIKIEKAIAFSYDHEKRVSPEDQFFWGERRIS